MNYKLKNVLQDYRHLGNRIGGLSPEEVDQQIGHELENPATYERIRERIVRIKLSKERPPVESWK